MESKSKKRKEKKGRNYPYLHFRFWCYPGKNYISDYRYNGKVDELFESDYDLLIPEQCTGLKDKKRQWVYEGDTLEFTTKNLGKELSTILKNLEETSKRPWIESGKFFATVTRDPCEPCNMILEVLDQSKNNAKLTTYLPISFCKRGLVTGTKPKKGTPKVDIKSKPLNLKIKTNSKS